MSCGHRGSGLEALSQSSFDEGQAPSSKGFHLYLGLTQSRQGVGLLLSIILGPGPWKWQCDHFKGWHRAFLSWFLCKA